MVLGFRSRPQHIAQNIIVGLDFDGTMAYGAHVRVWYAKKFYNVNLTEQQILGETWPKELGKDKYRQMADAADSDFMMMQTLAPGCKEVLQQLYIQGFRFAVVTSRAPKLRDAALKFISHHSLPIQYLHVTDHSPKDYLCNKLHARAFLDDGLYNLKGLIGSSCRPIFIRQPWNVHEPTPPANSSVITINNWLQFERTLLQIKEMHEAICYFNKWENAYYNLQKIGGLWAAKPELCLKYLVDYRKAEVITART